ncbi:hypothetical protein WN48_00856 [Eufriesea mexicana]|nr:hypothetical protein WN48_00856 [Eufriesea mexicana]
MGKLSLRFWEQRDDKQSIINEASRMAYSIVGNTLSTLARIEIKGARWRASRYGQGSPNPKKGAMGLSSKRRGGGSGGGRFLRGAISVLYKEPLANAISLCLVRMCERRVSILLYVAGQYGHRDLWAVCMWKWCQRLVTCLPQARHLHSAGEASDTANIS